MVMTIKQIENFGKKNKYFVNRRYDGVKGEYHGTLSRKTGDDSYSVENYSLFLEQVNNQLLGTEPVEKLETLLPVINADIFQAYTDREKAIQKRKQRIEDIKTPLNLYGPNKYIVKKSHGRPNTFVYYIVDIENGLLFEINEALLTEELRDNAIPIKYPKLLVKSLKDDLKNEYLEDYLKEVEKFKNI